MASNHRRSGTSGLHNLENRMNSTELKQPQQDACGRRGGGGCAPAGSQDELLLPAYWRGEVVNVARPSRKAFAVIDAPETKQ